MVAYVILYLFVGKYLKEDSRLCHDLCNLKSLSSKPTPKSKLLAFLLLFLFIMYLDDGCLGYKDDLLRQDSPCLN